MDINNPRIERHRSLSKNINESTNYDLNYLEILTNQYKILESMKSNEMQSISKNQKTQIMASMLPDEILSHEINYIPRVFETVLFFVDVSGFTELSDKFSQLGKGSASKLSYVLNTYIGNMIQEVLSHGGDILKFSGDSFLVAFKTSSVASMQDAVHEAIDTAMIIQKHYGGYTTDIGVVLKVKIGISAGKVYFSLIGTEETSAYIIVGSPLWEVKKAETMCSAGDVIVGYSAWQYVNPIDYHWKQLDDNFHYKITGFSDVWRSIQRVTSSINLDEDPPSLGSVITYSRESNNTFIEDNVSISSFKDLFQLRPIINLVLIKNINHLLPRFLIPPLYKAIESNEPIEYLTEMRQVVTVLINIVTTKITLLELIKLADSAFQLICAAVKFHDGVVNKVSLFDKDLMFLCIFGLRGYKHQLESQIALRCAAEAFKVLSELPNVSTVSIGVTSGMTYCGVVGHTLRREYSVLSISVNRAARLMMVYINKITCDRDTFLTSKMESKNFTLQPYMELKGLHSVGPIYEFLEIIEHQNIDVPIESSKPLIGRDDIINHILKLLKRALNTFEYYKIGKHNAVLIEKTCALLIGETQIGKSHIINELFSIAFQKGYKCLKLKLHVTQRRKPYSMISVLLCHPLKISSSTNVNEKQMKIATALKSLNSNKYLYALNPIFDVLFDYPEVPLENDFEYTDDQSVLLLKESFFKDFNVFCVLSISDRIKDIGTYTNIWKSHLVETIKIEPVDKIYQCRIACQILNVLAIPLDLERAIHIRSNGNSGWLDSFLISLIQSGILQLIHMTAAKALTMGLVFHDCFEDSINNTVRKTININDWNMYAITFNNDDIKKSSNNLSYNINFINENKIIPVAILTDSFLVEEHENELTVDSFNLIIFDSLSAFEQMICKCGSVLGITFLRSMLIYVMSIANENQIARSIQKLFELRVINCGAGDFSGGAKVFHRNVEVTDFIVPRCICVGVLIPDEFKSFPKYAFCGYVHFRLPRFTETVYNLLTEQQRLDFHQRALIYLENETRKCDSCGGGYFTNILNDMVDNSESQVLYADSAFINDGNAYELFSIHSITPASSNHLEKSRTSFNIKSKHPKTQPYIISYAEYNFSQCECNMILYTMYNMIIYHCNGAFLYRKLIDAQIEFAYICIIIKNLPRAVHLLDEAFNGLEKLTNKYLNIDFDDTLVPYLYGRIYTLKGECYYKIKQQEKAFENFYKAVTVMGISFPQTKAKVRNRTINRILSKIKTALKPFDKQEAISYSVLAISVTQQLSDCFSAMFLLFFDCNMLELAYLAAVCSLEQALRCHRNFYSVALGFSNVLLITHHIGKTKDWLLAKSMELVPSFHDTIDAKCLSAVLKMYTSFLLCQLSRNDKEQAIQICYIIINMSNSIRMPSFKWRIIPILVDFLIGLFRLDEAVDILQHLETVAYKIASNAGLTWYYALCLDIQLDTGYTIVHYQKCERFYLDRFDTLDINNDVLALARFYTNLWLWCVRNEFWETSNIWLAKIRQYLIVKPQDSWVNTFTAVRYLEGLLIMLVGSFDSRNVTSLIEQEKEIKILFKQIEKTFLQSKTYLCTYMVMIVYYKQIKHFHVSHMKKFKSTKKFCLMRQSKARYVIIKHIEKCWRRELTPIEHDFWIDHCDINNIYYWQNYKNDLSYHPYSLPLPKSGFY